MAKAKTENEDEGGLRSRMYLHEAFVQWILDEFGVDLDTLSAAEIVAWRAAKNNAWRKTDTYHELVAEKGAEREAAKAERAAAKASKPAAAKKATKATKKAPAKKAPAKKAAAKKASKRTAAAAASEDDPFS